jgi:hypothetical protein
LLTPTKWSQPALSVINKGDITMKPKLTLDHIRAIAGAIGAQWKGDTLCLADWGHVLEHAAFEGFDVSTNLRNINAKRPPGIKPIALTPLEKQQTVYDTLDQNIPGGNHRAWFENQRRLVQDALANVEQAHITHR